MVEDQTICGQAPFFNHPHIGQHGDNSPLTVRHDIDSVTFRIWISTNSQDQVRQPPCGIRLINTVGVLVDRVSALAGLWISRDGHVMQKFLHQHLVFNYV
ncbi:hypothetical protein HRX48_004228 [Salmonella enterica]|nr:hypothetical protein [Salmonella enterica]EEP7589682.1 hypothetical protein [Salmonella enterica]EFQ7301979.1 hypothetical protein [Salmonella enterica]EFR2198196.1 hypothetical protein [Salmonella enterica]EFR2325954.1 hypothetical protein [Salmonella enterica]